MLRDHPIADRPRIYGKWNGKDRGRVAHLCGSKAGKLARSTGQGSWEGKGSEYSDFEVLMGRGCGSPLRGLED